MFRVNLRRTSELFYLSFRKFETRSRFSILFSIFDVKREKKNHLDNLKWKRRSMNVDMLDVSRQFTSSELVFISLFENSKRVLDFRRETC